jgi:hypothetical protein
MVTQDTKAPPMVAIPFSTLHIVGPLPTPTIEIAPSVLVPIIAPTITVTQPSNSDHEDLL